MAEVTARGSDDAVLWRLYSWTTVQAGGIHSLVEQCVDIRRDASGVGDVLDRAGP